jgi:phosphonate transport system ATP-binding protein
MYTPMPDYAIRVDGLCKHYPKAQHPALDRLTFAVQRGSFTVVLGRSGSGKTTLFRCLNGMLAPDAGDICIEDQRITQLRGRVRRAARERIATIFQQYNLIQRLSVLDNVLAARLPHVPFWRAVLRRFPSPDEQWALGCLDRVGMLEFAERRADALSGGQQQRVAIARALAQRPTIILADEPIASLDPASATMVLDELREVSQEKGITVLCSLHQEDFALRYATHIIGLRAGRVVVDVPCRSFGNNERKAIYKPT